MAGIWSSVTASHRSGVCMHKLINQSFRMWRVPLLRRLVICKDSILTRNRCLISSETWWQKHIAELHAELDRVGHVRTVGMWNRDLKKKPPCNEMLLRLLSHISAFYPKWLGFWDYCHQKTKEKLAYEETFWNAFCN